MKIKFTFLLLIANCSLLIVKADWVQVNNGLTNLNVNALTSYTSGSVNYIFAGTLEFPSSLFVSTNNGNSWAVSWQIPNVVWALATTSGGGLNYVFAGTGNGMGYTTNNGANWYSAGLPHWIYSIAASGNYVFAGCRWQTFDSGGVYKSTNYGANWVRTLYGPEINDIAINSNYVYVAAGGGANQIMGIFKSTDNGESWGPPSVSNRTFLSIAINGSNIFAGSNGVYRSTDNGGNWVHTSLDSSGSIYSLLIYNNIIFAGGGGGFWTSTNTGINWTQRNEGLIGFVKALVVSNIYIYAGTDGLGIYRRPLSELVGFKPISNEIPKDFVLFQNYPNPFNGQTTLAFDIIKRDRYILKILDMLGRPVDVAYDGILESGSYKINYSASKLASGVYFYSLISGSINETKKCILVK